MTKKNLGKKEETKDKKIEKSPEDLAKEYLSGWQRCKADFENYKKRQAELQKEISLFALKNFVFELLPILDNFHASTDHVPQNHKDDPWVTGIMHIRKQLESTLGNYGVVEIEAKVGDDFNPKYHEAVKECAEGEEEKEECKNKIKQIIQRGYKLGEKVLRPVRVIVE